MQNHDPSTVWTVPEPFRTIYTHATEVPAGSRQLHVSGQLGVAPDGVMRPDFAGQLEAAMDNVEARRRRWASERPPAVTVVVVAALARPNALVEVEVTAAARG